MGYLYNEDEFETVAQMQFYTPIVLNLFEYLNGRINPNNKCIPLIAGFDEDMFACFQFPNHMTIFLGSIIDKYGFVEDPKSYDTVMSVAALCIAHELYHSEQHIDSIAYKNDNNYREFIENGAEYNAEKFCVDHKEDFRKLFGFEYSAKVYEKKTKIEYRNERQIIADAVLGFLRNIKSYEEVENLLDNNENVFLSIDNRDIGGDIEAITLKEGDKYASYDGLAEFFAKTRPTWALPVFAFQTFISDYTDSQGIKFKGYFIKIKGYEYNPFYM